jgi:hypothetical protein
MRVALKLVKPKTVSGAHTQAAGGWGWGHVMRERCTPTTSSATHPQPLSAARRLTETLDNQTAKVAETGTTEGRSDVNHGPDVGLGVPDDLADLAPLPDVRLGAHVVLADTVQCNETVITVAEETSGHGRVGEEPCDNRDEEGRHTADGEENGLVRVDTLGDVTNAPGDERTGNGGHRVGNLVRDGTVTLLATSPSG